MESRDESKKRLKDVAVTDSSGGMSGEANDPDASDLARMTNQADASRLSDTLTSTGSPGTDPTGVEFCTTTIVSAAPGEETKGLSLLGQLTSENINVRAWNTRIVLRKCEIVIRRCDSNNSESHRNRQQNVRKRRKRYSSECTSTEIGAVDTETSSEDTGDSTHDSLSTEDETFVKSGDSDYTPSIGRCRRRAPMIQTRSKKIEQETKMKTRRDEKLSLETRKRNLRRIVSSTDDEDNSNFSISLSSDSSPVKKRTRSSRPRPKSSTPAPIPPRRHGTFRRVKLRKRRTPANLYTEIGQSSGEDDSDFHVEDSPPDKRLLATTDGTSDLQPPLPSPIPSASVSPPLEAVEELSVPARPASPGESLWIEVEEFIREAEKTMEGFQVTIPTTTEADPAVVLSIPEVAPPSTTQAPPRTLDKFASPTSCGTYGCKPSIPPKCATPHLVSMLGNIHTPVVEQQERRLDVDASGRRHSSGMERAVPLTERFPSVVPVPTIEIGPPYDPMRSNQREEYTPEIVGDVQGKVCPYCSRLVACSKLELHGRHFHGRMDLAPFLYTCQYCVPHEPFQTMLTLIDHIEVRHSRILSIGNSSTIGPSRPQHQPVDPGFLGIRNVNFLQLRDHLAGVVAQNRPVTPNFLPGPQQTRPLINYFPPSSNQPTFIASTGGRRQMETLEESQLILHSICQSQLVNSLKLCNFERNRLTMGMAIAIKNRVKEALNRIFGQLQRSPLNEPVNMDPLIASLRQEIHSIVARVITAEILLRTGSNPSYVSPFVPNTEPGISSAQYPSGNSQPTAAGFPTTLPTGQPHIAPNEWSSPGSSVFAETTSLLASTNSTQMPSLSLTAPSSGCSLGFTGVIPNQGQSMFSTIQAAGAMNGKRLVSVHPQRSSPTTATSRTQITRDFGSTKLGLPQMPLPSSVVPLGPCLAHTEVVCDQRSSRSTITVEAGGVGAMKSTRIDSAQRRSPITTAGAGPQSANTMATGELGFPQSSASAPSPATSRCSVDRAGRLSSTIFYPLEAAGTVSLTIVSAPRSSPVPTAVAETSPNLGAIDLGLTEKSSASPATAQGSGCSSDRPQTISEQGTPPPSSALDQPKIVSAKESSPSPSPPDTTIALTIGDEQTEVVAGQRSSPSPTDESDEIVTISHQTSCLPGSDAAAGPDCDKPETPNTPAAECTTVAIYRNPEALLTSEPASSMPEMEPEDNEFECFSCEDCNIDFETEDEALDHLEQHHGHKSVQLVLPQIMN